jgi:putative ABC transport system permease protein
MLINYLKIFFRNLLKQGTYSILNIGGLAIGIASSFIILIYVIQESSYEKHFNDYGQVYRIATKFMTMGEFANGPEVLLEVAPEELPWIEQTTRVIATGLELSDGVKSIVEEGLVVERNFFELFPYPFTQGDASVVAFPKNRTV